jgi:Family of unknown function (DUF5996)
MNRQDAWPALPYEEWAPTKKTLHLVTQMMGKVRLALAPPQPSWLHTCLYLDARGFTTGAIPLDGSVLQVGLDVYDLVIWVRIGDGRTVTIPLSPDRSIAKIWSDLLRTLADLGIQADLWDKPQEMDDTTPLGSLTAVATIVPEHAQRFFRILGSIDAVFEEFRSSFFGRSGVQFWWGGFDFCVILFTGRKVDPPDHRGYILRYDLDAEQMNAGFWVGDDAHPNPTFFAYLIPRPPGCEVAPVQPALAGWAENMDEWMLSYDHVRASADPRAEILAFLRSVYQFAVSDAGWDGESHTYVAPPPAPRSRHRGVSERP